MNRSAASAPFVPKGFQANPFAAPVTNDNCDLTTPPGSPRPLPYSINPSTPPGSPHPLPYSISPSTPPGSPHSTTVSPKSSITSTVPMEVAFQPSIVTCSSSGNSSPSLSRLALLFSIVLFSTHCHVSLQIATLLLHLLLACRFCFRLSFHFVRICMPCTGCLPLAYFVASRLYFSFSFS